jgi:hypothetical protein
MNKTYLFILIYIDNNIDNIVNVGKNIVVLYYLIFKNAQLKIYSITKHFNVKYNQNNNHNDIDKFSHLLL